MRGAGLPIPRPHPDAGGGPYAMSLIESNVRVDNRLQHEIHLGARGGSLARVTTVCVRAADEGPYALTAAELASIESNKTREKLKTKANHVRATSEGQFNKLYTACSDGTPSD